jgi:hypothetical protein
VRASSRDPSAVIARSDSDEAIDIFACGMDCFAPLAMTVRAVPPLRGNCVVRMERSAIRETLPACPPVPDFASLHPGFYKADNQ